jgi:EmrB/QacA subfamily drug resistance transporter
MVALDQLVVATALTTVQRELHASLATLEWTVNAYGMAFAVLLMIGSSLGDRYGRRRVLVAGVSLFTLASVGCAVAPNVGLLIAARTVQGAGSALVMPAAMALLSAAYPAARRGRALGIFTALTGFAVVCGPLVGGAVTAGLGWQWIFWLNVPLGLAVVPLVRARVAESFGPRHRLDLVGCALATAALLDVVWGLIRGGAAGWSAPETYGALATSVPLFAAFIWWERRVDEPMLPLGMWRSAAFTAGSAASFLLYAVVTGSVFFLSQFLQASLRLSPIGAGLRMMPWTAAVLVVAPLSGKLVDRIGARRPLVVGLTMQAGGLVWIAYETHRGGGYASFVAALAVAGVGVTMAMPAVQSAVFNGVAQADVGKASGTFNTVRQLGGVFGVAVLSAVFAACGSYSSEATFRQGLAPALATAAALSLAGALVGGATRRAAPAPIVVDMRPAAAGVRAD